MRTSATSCNVFMYFTHNRFGHYFYSNLWTRSQGSQGCQKIRIFAQINLLSFCVKIAPKRHIFPKNHHATKEKIFKKFLRVLTVCQKLGVILESKVVQKLSLEKKVFDKYWSPKLIFLDKNFFRKNSINFWHPKLTLKVQFWHFLTNCHYS